jgi:hypothetical protein
MTVCTLFIGDKTFFGGINVTGNGNTIFDKILLTCVLSPYLLVKSFAPVATFPYIIVNANVTIIAFIYVPIHYCIKMVVCKEFYNFLVKNNLLVLRNALGCK